LLFVAALKGQTNSIRQSRRIVCAALKGQTNSIRQSRRIVCAALKGQTNSIRQSRRIVCAVFFIALALNGQMAPSVETPCLDENQVRQAMHEEALRLLTLKIEAEQNGSASGFDYHIEQAYEKIKKRLPPGPLSTAELATCLQQFLQNPSAADNDREFQSLIENFVLGMSLEIINTLQYECDQAVDLIAQVAKLEREIKSTPHPDRETLDRALRQSSLSKKMYGIVKNIDRRWRIPPAGSENFSAFNIWRKNMSGQSLDSDQRLVFDLGDRYQPQYPFLDKFMENYRRLAETFLQTVRNLNAMLDSSSDSDLNPAAQDK
jgi:hypothetical protein